MKKYDYVVVLNFLIPVTERTWRLVDQFSNFSDTSRDFEDLQDQIDDKRTVLCICRKQHLEDLKDAELVKAVTIFRDSQENGCEQINPRNLEFNLHLFLYLKAEIVSSFASQLFPHPVTFKFINP